VCFRQSTIGSTNGFCMRWLDHDPTHDDIKSVSWALEGALDARDLALKGITTDGSALYPEPIRESLGRCPISCAPSMSSQNWSKGS